MQSSAASSRPGPRSCSSRASSGERPISASGRRRSRPGFAAAMRDDDYTFATYRGHNHALSRGAPMGPLYAELFGRANGLMGGKGGSMHITDVEPPHDGLVRDRRRPPADRARRGVARPVPQVRPGRGLLLRRRDDEHRRVPRGAEHGGRLEGAGRVRLREQPVHGVHGDRGRDGGARGRPRTGRRPTGWRRSSSTATTPRRCTRSRSGRSPGPGRATGPSLVEAVTYRHGGHSRADPGKYRPDDEVEAWKARDPIPAQRARLVAAGVDEATLDEVDAETRAKVAEAEAFARAGAEPSPEVIETQVWANGGSSWRSDRA